MRRKEAYDEDLKINPGTEIAALAAASAALYKAV
jgi:hypothetical protein